MIMAKDITMVSIADLKLNPKNRNIHSEEQIQRLAEIIQYQGFRQPLVVSSRSGLVLAGHGRFQAAKQLKMLEVPVMYQDFDSDEQETAFGISDNGVALWAELDLSAINNDLAELGPDFDIAMLGIKDFELVIGDTEDLDGDPKGSMHDDFGAPPFSVLDARQGWWQERKRRWIDMGIRSELGRGGEEAASYKSQSAQSGLRDKPKTLGATPPQSGRPVQEDGEA